jgi:hypothetical protein
MPDMLPALNVQLPCVVQVSIIAIMFWQVEALLQCAHDPLGTLRAARLCRANFFNSNSTVGLVKRNP